MTTETAARRETTPPPLNGMPDDDEDKAVSSKLVDFTDDLHDFLGELDFFHTSISSLFDQDDCDVLAADRQKTGLHRTSRTLTEKGRELSERLDVIRAQLSDIGKLLG